MNKVYVGDVGTEIVLDCETDISAATGLSIQVRKPSGAVVTWTAVLEGARYVKHVVEAGELDERGIWVMQAAVELGTWEGLGESFMQLVYSPYT